MANTTFSGPVRSENGFQSVTKDATTGAFTVEATYDARPNFRRTIDSATLNTGAAVTTTLTTAQSGTLFEIDGTEYTVQRIESNDKYVVRMWVTENEF